MPRPDRRRHDVGDRARATIGPLLPGRRGQRGRVAEAAEAGAEAVAPPPPTRTGGRKEGSACTYTDNGM